MLQTGLFAAGFLICAMAIMLAITWSFSDQRVIDTDLAQGDAHRMA
ncbi:hypothetical protein [Bradyrhizobium genosp. A]